MTRRDFDTLARIVAADPVLFRVGHHFAARLTEAFPRFNSRLFFEAVTRHQSEQKTRAEAVSDAPRAG